MAGDLTKNFSLSEFAQRDPYRPVPTEYRQNVQRLAEQLQSLRDVVGRIVITSSYRTLAHNASLPGSSSTSQHLTAKAADFVVPGVPQSEVYCTILRLIPGSMEQGGLGWYGEKTMNRVPHVHYDVRGFKRRWNKSGGPLPVCPPVAPEEEDMTALDDHKKAQAAQLKVAGWFLIAAGYAVAGGKVPKWLQDKLKYVLA